MTVQQKEKELLDLIARYKFLTGCKDNGLLDLGTYSKILYQLGEENMEHLDEHHNDMRAFFDGVKEGK